MCDFLPQHQHVQISVEVDVIGGVCYGLRVSQLHLRLQNYAIVQPSKLFDFVPETPTGRRNICFVA